MILMIFLLVRKEGYHKSLSQTNVSHSHKVFELGLVIFSVFKIKKAFSYSWSLDWLCFPQLYCYKIDAFNQCNQWWTCFIEFCFFISVDVNRHSILSLRTSVAAAFPNLLKTQNWNWELILSDTAEWTPQWTAEWTTDRLCWVNCWVNS